MGSSGGNSGWFYPFLRLVSWDPLAGGVVWAPAPTAGEIKLGLVGGRANPGADGPVSSNSRREY